MKRICTIALAVLFPILIVVMGVMGVKIFSGDYDIVAEAYVLLGCWALTLVCTLVVKWSGAVCPHCGKRSFANGPFCPQCGQKLEK
ncbi:MAG: hypothetical protein IKV55_01125 [Oscillospiraceae bacterium]|nr:hypothetical protein [Oscillospiraceae bacterium]